MTCFADGGTRFIPNSVDTGVWRAIATAANAEKESYEE